MNATTIKLTLLFLITIAIAAPARAGPVLPTWLARVNTITTFDRETGIQTSTTSVGSLTGGNTFAVADIEDYVTTNSIVSVVLADYQGSHPAITLAITRALWDFSNVPAGPVALDIFSYPASAVPPNLTSPPAGTTLMREALIPSGTDLPGPYLIPISAGSSTSEAFLIAIPQFDPHLAAASVIGTLESDTGLTTSAVPEPSTFVLASIAALAGLGCAWRRWPI
jgi:hypothetical protein